MPPAIRTSIALVLSLAACPAYAVYAPIPEEEQGKMLTVYVASGSYFDSNMFGDAVTPRSSMVYQIAPRAVFNFSSGDQTFLSASYQLSLDYFADRLGKKTLDSHTFNARMQHTFSPRLECELNDTFQVIRNPESLLPGVGTFLSTDQSYQLHQIDGRLSSNLTKRIALSAKARAANFSYETATLSRSLDRSEYLAGLALTRTMLPELQVIGEYRHQLIRYGTDGSHKDKNSDFALLGADYALNARLAFSSRLGAEYRRRRSEDAATMPYAEFAWKMDYSQGSYLSLGYGFSLEEVSNLDVYNDMAVHRFFANVQHALTSELALTATTSWEPSVLNGRAGISADRDETNFKYGVAIVYKLSRRLTLSATLDRDDIASDDASRRLLRTRAGASVRWIF